MQSKRGQARLLTIRQRPVKQVVLGTDGLNLPQRVPTMPGQGRCPVLDELPEF